VKKYLSMVLCCLLILSLFSAPAYAALPDTDGITQSDYFICYGTTMSRQGGGTLLISFSTAGVGLCDVLGVATFRIQCWDEDDEHWYDITVDIPGETGTNVATYNFSRYFYGTAGRKYRVCATFVCTKYGMGTETKPYSSPAIVA